MKYNSLEALKIKLPRFKKLLRDLENNYFKFIDEIQDIFVELSNVQKVSINDKNNLQNTEFENKNFLDKLKSKYPSEFISEVEDIFSKVSMPLQKGITNYLMIKDDIDNKNIDKIKRVALNIEAVDSLNKISTDLSEVLSAWDYYNSLIFNNPEFFRIECIFNGFFNNPSFVGIPEDLVGYVDFIKNNKDFALNYGL